MPRWSEIATDGRLPLRLTAYDGSATGPVDSPFTLDIKTPRGINYLATAPGDLGMARAYVSGEMDARGVHPGDPYDVLKVMEDLQLRRPSADASSHRSRGRSGGNGCVPSHPHRRRRCHGGAGSPKVCGTPRPATPRSIHHHYDVSNAFYEMVLGTSMAYTCAVYADPNSTLEQAQENKYRLVFDKLRLQEGDRLLDIGCGWGGMVRYAARRGVKVIGATLSKQQAEWAQKAIAEEGLSDLAEVRHSDYRDVAETGFDAVSSIGLTEHIGVQNYPAYFALHLARKLRDGGLFLNHCITRPDNTAPRASRRLHRPLRLPGRRADRFRPDHHRDPERRLRGPARGEPARALRADARANGARTWSRTGTSASRRSARAPRRCGACTWPVRGSASSATSFSCTRFSA